MHQTTDTKAKGWIRKVAPEMAPPSLNDNTADVDRLIKGIRKVLPENEILFDFPLAREIPSILRKYDYQVEAVLFEDHDRFHLCGILPAAPDVSLYGLAVDLGSSTVVVRLLNLSTHECIDETSFHNPQIEIGPDILMRIHYAAQEGGLQKLQSLVRDRLNQEIRALCRKHTIEPTRIAGMAAAGNTTMTHLFLGLDPYWLCREPYIPAVNSPSIIKAHELALDILPGAPVLVFPNVGSYFGGDLIAGILASGMNQQEEISLLVDVGTNAEVVIGNSDWLMACAGAAGPALEGGVANMGMMAGPGVIDKVTIDPDTHEFQIRTIDHQAPVGICGSGLIDLVAQLFLTGMIDIRGKFVRRACGDLLREKDGIRELVVVKPEESGTGEALTLAQTDIDGLIRSKAAMFTILTTITNTVGIPFNGIRHFFIAGTFGSYIDPRSAITIGMIPDLPLETYVPLGNTSLQGATMGLLSAEARESIFRIRDQITYLELNVNQEFMNLFSAAKFIPHTDKSIFPSVRPVNPD
ncbi:MAG: DUF4445 domain-containing protein [Deltaproteobacteria bacterium]|nr:DUF4445 domain-containing protein [Deltaproteobacteria bacterium]